MYRPLSRGTSILAALVFVGILGAVAWGVSALGPSAASGSQSAAADAAAAGAPATASGSPTIPLCNAYASAQKIQIASEEDANKQPCVCRNPAQPNAKPAVPQSFNTLQYTVTAQLSKGNPVANATVQKLPEQTADGSQKCSVQTCFGGKCSTATGSGSDVFKALSAAPQSYFNNMATAVASGQANLTDYPPMSDASLAQFKSAFGNLQSANSDMTVVPEAGPIAGPDFGKYSAQQISSAQTQLDNYSTCGQSDCTGITDASANGSLSDYCAANPGDTASCPSANNPGLKDVSQLNCGSSACADLNGNTYNGPAGANPNQPYTDCSGSDCIAVASTPEQKAQLESAGYTCDSDNNGGDGYGCTKPNTGSKATPNTFTPTSQQPQQRQGGGLLNSLFGGGSGGGAGSGLGSGASGLLNSLLQGALKGLSQGIAASNAPACPSDPTAYAQQQQQYNMQMQQYQLQLQQYQLQQQLAQINGSIYYAAPVMPTPPTPCQPTSSSNTCPAAPAQPDPSGCQAGTWKPVTTSMSNGAQCTTSWQCVPGGATTPTAQISCQPLTADVGMSVAISFSCGNATGSAGAGFDTGNALSGSTSTIIATPPSNATGQVFGVKCTNQSLSAQAQCTVQVGKASIILVANPRVVNSGEASTIGWITSGMQSCVVSSPDLPDFTAQNAGNTSVNGMATTSPLTAPAHILLHCTTTAGGTKDATTTVGVVGVSDDGGTITGYSSIDGQTVARGASATIGWSATGTPSGSKIALWLYDIARGKTTALIKSGLDASSTYAWTLPTDTSACDSSVNVCALDLTSGQSYGIEIDAYTGSDSNPTYGAYGYTPDPFTIQ